MQKSKEQIPNCFFIICGFLLAGTVDIFLALIISSVVMKLYNFDSHIAITYFFGIMFATFPDIDALSHLLKKGNIYADHRDWTHYPIIIFPIFVLIAMFSLPHAIIAALCLIFHYIHDSLDIKENEGIGIKWLAPFKTNVYLISLNKIKNWQLITKAKLQQIKKFEQQKETMVKWVNKNYLAINESSVAGIIALVAIIIFVLW